MSKFSDQLLEHYDNLKSTGQITEAADKDQYTDATLSLHQPKFNKALIEKASAELIAANLFETGVMSGPVEKAAVEIYNREAGVTTTEVDEGGQIKQGKTTYGTVTLEAVGYKLRSVLTTEAIEDAQNAGNLNIVARAIANLAKDIQEEIDAKLMALMVAGASAGNVDVSKGVKAAKVVADEIVSAVVDSIQNIKKKHYRPDFVLVDNTIFGYLAKADEFVHADKYGSTELQQSGFMGKIRGLEVYESMNMTANKAIVGKRKTFGIYKVYVPMQFKGPVYDPDFDKDTYVIRQRAAMKITVGEALATITIVA